VWPVVTALRKKGAGLSSTSRLSLLDMVLDLASRFRNAGDKLWEILLRLGDLGGLQVRGCGGTS
jgi:hypothetical protein